ncbi:acetyltransferase [Phenylobacterium sp. Root77]|uniref:GNAT family N-acetyltransferase n=1 Tax=unclassified Phenylobacterium TaxID=2640670 RepID=UPI0006F964C6|nr:MULTISPECIES: GNAT family N-acetyltransferase [unclassified Phenylobacterium]KQW70493.1 acetyltransferase [Phenylobacterium sp. Root1277]KQW91086.1 acetyltransferase [Phenylobacterium sp. Root1290]KRC39279.1 acetyltransferase [Phenylobacterium sp. Root77]
MQQPTIRRADPSDAQVLSELGARTFTETFAHLYPPQDLADFLARAYGLERTRADLADPAKAQWLVEAGGEAVGYALAGPCDLPHPDVTAASGELKRFYLLKDWQGGGTGGRLFQDVMAWLERDGPRDLWIGVWSENVGAQRFYGRHGFVRVGDYGFQVGSVTDHEFILRRAAQGLST